MRSAARVLTAGLSAVTAVAAAGATLLPAQAKPADEGVVTARGGLTVRAAPSVQAAAEGHQAHGASVPVVCRIDGSIVDGETTWYALPPTLHEWVSGSYLDVDGTVPECTADQGGTEGRASTALNVRRGPNSADQLLGEVARGQRLELQCKLTSQTVAGEALWYKLDDAQGWVSAHYVDHVGRAPGWCNA